MRSPGVTFLAPPRSAPGSGRPPGLVAGMTRVLWRFCTLMNTMAASSLASFSACRVWPQHRIRCCAHAIRRARLKAGRHRRGHAGRCGVVFTCGAEPLACLSPRTSRMAVYSFLSTASACPSPMPSRYTTTTSGGTRLRRMYWYASCSTAAVMWAASRTSVRGG